MIVNFFQDQSLIDVTKGKRKW